jgi:hypothetical protein
MRWTRVVEVAGEPDTAFGLLSDIGRWPKLFPHVRRVERSATTATARIPFTTVDYSAGWLPVRCRCRIVADADVRRVGVQQLRGNMAGVRECWSIEPLTWGRCRLSYACDDTHHRSVLGGIYASQLIVRLADRTLELAALLAEADFSAHYQGVNHS